MQSLTRLPLPVKQRCPLLNSATLRHRANTGGPNQAQRNVGRTQGDASERDYRAGPGRGGGRDGQRRGGSSVRGRGPGLGRGRGRSDSDPRETTIGSSSPSRGNRWSRPPARGGRGPGRSTTQRGRYNNRYKDDSDSDEEGLEDNMDDGIDEGFVVIGRVDPTSQSPASQEAVGAASAGAVAAAGGAADANADRTRAVPGTGGGSSGGSSTATADPLDGARFWSEASGIEDIDEDEEEEEEEQEGDPEEGEVVEEETSPLAMLERLRQMGFTLEDTQPPSQPQSSPPSTATTNSTAPANQSRSDTIHNDHQPCTSEGQQKPAATAAAAAHRTATAAADAALRDLRDVFLATMQSPRLPPGYLGPVEVQVEPRSEKRGTGSEQAVKAGQLKQGQTSWDVQVGKEEGDGTATAPTTPTLTTPTTTEGPINRGATSLRTTRAVAAGELLAISVPLAIRYCARGSTPENEELAEMMMAGVTGVGTGEIGEEGAGEGGAQARQGGDDGVESEAGAVMNSFLGLTDLQQSLLGLMWQGHGENTTVTVPTAPLAAAALGKLTGGAPSGTTAKRGGQVAGRVGGSGGGGGVGPVKRAFLEMVAQSAVDESAPRAPPLLSAAELYTLVNMNCLGEDFQDPALCALRGEVPRGHIGMWPEAAFAAHSCAPTATAFTVGDRLSMRAVTDLPKGGEVTLNWLGSLITAPLHIRRGELQQQYGFTCGCVRCTAEARYDGTPLAELLSTTYATCQQLAKQLEVATAAGDLGTVAAVRSHLQELQRALEGGMRTARPRITGRGRRWLQASIYDMYDLLSLCADELAAAGPQSPPPPAQLHSGAPSKSSPSRDTTAPSSASGLIDTESLAQCCRILEATTCGSDAHTYLSAELTVRTLERFGPRHEEYGQARAALVRAYGVRYGNVGPGVMEQLVAARLSAQDDPEEV